MNLASCILGITKNHEKPQDIIGIFTNQPMLWDGLGVMIFHGLQVLEVLLRLVYPMQTCQVCYIHTSFDFGKWEVTGMFSHLYCRCGEVSMDYVNLSPVWSGLAVHILDVKGCFSPIKQTYVISIGLSCRLPICLALWYGKMYWITSILEFYRMARLALQLASLHPSSDLPKQHQCGCHTFWQTALDEWGILYMCVGAWVQVCMFISPRVW